MLALAGLMQSSSALAQGNQKTQAVGSFSNMKYTDEHAYGYAVELWRYNHTLVGLFLASEGLAGDTPTGLLEKLSFDEKTGAISFEAKLSMGVVYSQQHDGVPSRDVFRFKGILKRNQLRGRLERLDMLEPQPAPQTEQIVLKREESNSALAAYKNYADWRQYADEILKFRGPRW